MKITDYPKATELASDDSFIIDGPTNGTRHILKENLPWGEGGGGSVPGTEPAWVSHRNTYRGKNLGSIFTDEQKSAIANETFDDLYIGDYWSIGNFDWIIADINYWLNTGGNLEEKCTTPHLVIVPRTSLYTIKMNDTNTTNGGYLGSKLYTQGLNDAKTMIYTAFGENNILTHEEQLSNAVTNGYVSGVTWIQSKVEIMNQIMVIGSMVFPGYPSVGSPGSNYTIDKTQLSLFRLNPISILTGAEYYLRDVTSAASFTAIMGSGNVHAYQPAYASGAGVRPAFGLIGNA